MYSKAIFGGLCLLAVLSISSCATLDSMLYKNKCTGSAETLGASQGASFKGPESYNFYAEKCQQFGVIPDKEQYLVGLEKGSIEACGGKGTKEASEGIDYSPGSNCDKGDRESAYKSAYNDALGEYCNEKNAMEFGKLGKEFNGSICSAESKPTLRTAYLKGKAHTELLAEQKKLTQEVADYKAKLKNSGLPSDIRDDYTNLIVDREIKLEKINRQIDEGNASTGSNLGW